MGAMKPAFAGHGHMIGLYSRPSNGDMTGTSHWFPGQGQTQLGDCLEFEFESAEANARFPK